MLRPLLFLAAAMAAFLPLSHAAERPSDSQIRAAMLGTWIDPPDSSDYDGRPAREVFRADGTYVFYLYRDSECRILARQLEVKWIVEGGVLTSTTADGKVMRDQVVSIGPRRMTLHSLDDGSTYIREKSQACIETGA